MSFFFLMIRRPPRSTLFPYTNALPICDAPVRPGPIGPVAAHEAQRVAEELAGAGEFLGYALRFVSGYWADRTGAYWRIADRKSVRVGKECRSRWSPYH